MSYLQINSSMKDIIISAKRIKIELYTLSICFFVSFISNIGAIVYYKSPFKETFTSILYVVIFTIFIYVLWSSIRLIKVLFYKVLKK
jgi:hypothetical protein